MDENKLTQDAEELSQSYMNKIQQGAATVGRNTLRIGKKALKGVTKNAIKLATNFMAALAKLLLAALPYVLVVIFIIFFIAIIYNWQLDERGSSGQLSQDPSNENVVEVVDGIQTAVALTEPQAIIDAYYKYMACNSHQKVYVDSNGNEIWLKFSDTDDTSDFSGLIDIYQKENYFYLSSYFIKMADELLHNNEFYYPEQIIKPVYAKMLPLETPDPSNPNKKYITALPLVDDGSSNAKALHNSSQAYAIADSLAASNDEPIKRDKLSSDATLDMLSHSSAYKKQTHYVTDDAGNNLSAEVYKPDSSGVKENGIWDYGFGSVLQYEAMTKDKYINCTFNSFTIHTHELYPYTDADGEEQTGVRCHGADGDYVITISAGDTADSLSGKISAYESDTRTVAKSPSYEELSKMVNTEANKHLEMLIQPEDKKLSERHFNNLTLNEAFGNSSNTTGLYPLKIPVISSAATFSGNIRYEYENEAISQELQSVESSLSFNNALRDDCTTLVYSFGTTAAAGTGVADISPGGDDCLAGNLTCVRSGTVWDVHPSSSPKEISVPVGFQYIEDYCSHYKTYVPNTVRADMDFQKRVNEEIASYNSTMDYNKDGKITNMDFLLGLGLMRPYSGDVLTATNGGSGSIELSSDDTALMAQVNCSNDSNGELLLLAKAIASEAGPNKLDELMCGAVMLNRVNDSRFPNTLVGVLSAGNGSQYASWPNKIRDAMPTESEMASAKQVLNGEFSIPSNIVFQKADFLTPEGTTYMMVVNGPGYYTHVYQISKYDNAIAQTDRFGRVALTESQARNLAETLYQADVTAGISPELGYLGIAHGSGSVSSSGYTDKNGQKLYAVTGFDIMTAITNMHQYQENVDNGNDTGLLGWFVNIGKSISNTIKDFQGYIKSVFGSSWNNATPDYYLMYNYNVPLSSMRDTVFQAITFNEQTTYSDAADSIDPDALMFIFVGKEASIGFGTNGLGGGWVPGTGSVFEDFSSPTMNYYQSTSSWSETSGSVTLAVPEGTLVQAVSNGKITDITGDDNYTVTITTKSGDKNIIVKYSNLASVSVSKNQNVGKNDKIGTVGDGGMILSVIVDGQNVNPLDYFYQPVYSSGAAFADILTNGYIDESKRAALEAAINSANNNITGVLDKWHTSPINTKSVGECTWWAYGRGWQYCEANGTMPAGGFANSYGNGGDYYDRVQQAGHFAVGQTARAGSWVVWTRVTPDSRGQYYGHVAFVEAVDKDGSIWISESARSIWDSHDGTGIALRKIAAPYNYGSGGGFKFKGFVYLDSPL